jgi:hypothetical protein
VVNPKLQKGQSTEVFATFLNDGEAVDGVTIYFYDGDPAEGGRLFDAERVSHIRAGAVQRVNVPYRPKECGKHELYIKVTAAGVVGSIGKAERTLDVECPAPVCATQACMKSAQYYALNINLLPKGAVTVAGGGLLSAVSTTNATAVKLALQGGDGGQQYFNQQFVALQLNLPGASDPGRKTEQSNLLCYGANFQPTQLSTGVTLNPGMTIGQLLDQGRIAAKQGKTIDLRTIAAVMNLINGNDPSGRCSR